MSIEKELKAIHQQKHDIEENWLKATSFKPRAGQLIVYDVDGTHSTPRIKIGDGKTNVNDLPFATEKVAIYNGDGENAIQQELRSDTFTLVNEYVNSNTEVQRADNGEIIAGALGFHSTSFNGRSQALGKGAFAEGVETVALGKYSHAQGNATFAAGGNAHSEGLLTSALGESSHAEGNSSVTEGEAAHAEGYYTKATGNGSHSEGFETQAAGSSSHAEGSNTQATADSAHAEGGNTIASGTMSHAEGVTTRAIGNNSHAEGDRTEAHGVSSHAEGANTKALKDYSHAEGSDTEANGISAHAEGVGSKATGDYCHAEGNNTKANGEAAHSEGFKTEAFQWAHAEGYSTKAHNKGHAEGMHTEAVGEAAHAEGTHTYAETFAHAEGGASKATGKASHAEGSQTLASGKASHAGGEGTIALASAQTAIGRWNNPKEDTLFEVGNGYSPEKRQNAFEVYQDGHAEVQTQGTSDKSVVTKGYFDANNNNNTNSFKHLLEIKNATRNESVIVNQTNMSFLESGNIYEVTKVANLDIPNSFVSVDISSYGNSNDLIVYVKSLPGKLPVISLFKGPNAGSEQYIPVYTDNNNRYAKLPAELSVITLYNSSLSDDYHNTDCIELYKVKKSFNFMGSDTDSCRYVNVSLDYGSNAYLFIDNPNQVISDYSESNLIQIIENIQENSVGQTTTEGGEIFNDIETNKSFNSYSHTEGTQNISSTMGFKILNMGIDEENSQLVLELEGDATSLLDSSIITKRDEYGLENSISFQWSQNFDLSCNIISINFSGPNTSGRLDKIPNDFDLSLATSGWLWVPTNPEIGNVQLGTAAHTEGYGNKAVQVGTHAEGYNNIAAGKYSHAEGRDNITAYGAHAEGMNNKSLGQCSHTEGSQNIAKRNNTHAEGTYTQALFDNAHAEGSHTIAGTATSGHGAHAEGRLSQALGNAAHSEGNETKATADFAHSEGDKSTASGVASHAEGRSTASGLQSHAEGTGTASNEKAHAEGGASKATGKASHAEGDSTAANGLASHAEGSWTTASGDAAHAEGVVTNATAKGAHAEGVSTKAQKEGAHAEGKNTTAHGVASHASGIGTTAVGTAQTAIGKYNAEEWDGSLFVIGNGSAAVKDENGAIVTPEVRSTIFKVKENSDVILKNGLIKGVKNPVDGTDATNKTYVDTKISGKQNKFADVTISENAGVTQYNLTTKGNISIVGANDGQGNSSNSQDPYTGKIEIISNIYDTPSYTNGVRIGVDDVRPGGDGDYSYMFTRMGLISSKGSPASRLSINGNNSTELTSNYCGIHIGNDPYSMMFNTDDSNILVHSDTSKLTLNAREIELGLPAYYGNENGVGAFPEGSITRVDTISGKQPKIVSNTDVNDDSSHYFDAVLIGHSSNPLHVGTEGISRTGEYRFNATNDSIYITRSFQGSIGVYNAVNTSDLKENEIAIDTTNNKTYIKTKEVVFNKRTTTEDNSTELLVSSGNGTVRYTNLAAPVNPTDAVNKQYVDDLIAALIPQLTEQIKAQLAEEYNH